MRVELRAVDPTAPHFGELLTTELLKKRVDRAHELIQSSKKPTLEAEASEFLKRSIVRLKLSMRSLDRIAKVGRSIAALDDREEVRQSDIAEALNYRIAKYDLESSQSRRTSDKSETPVQEGQEGEASPQCETTNNVKAANPTST